MLTIRLFDGTDADYETMIAIDTAVFAEYPMTIAEWRHIDATRDPAYLFQRDMIERNGDAVAFGDYGQASWAFHPRKFFFHAYVHPDHEHPDIRPAYFEHVMGALAERDPVAITTGMLEDREADLRFFAALGFKEIMRSPLSELDVIAFDETPFAHIPAQVRAAGIRIASLRELQKLDPDWKPRLYALHCAIEQDVPSPGARVKPSLEEFEQQTLHNPNFTADGWFVALDGDRYVGMTHTWLNPLDAEKLNGSLTGVIRSHRRRGIATALKLRLIDFARRYGAKTLTTGNEENNPMYQINLRLGFQPKPAWVEFEKEIRTE